MKKDKEQLFYLLDNSAGMHPSENEDQQGEVCHQYRFLPGGIYSKPTGKEEPQESRTEPLSWKDGVGIARRLRGLELTGQNKRKGSYTDNDFLKSVLGFHSDCDQIASCECLERLHTLRNTTRKKQTKHPGS